MPNDVAKTSSDGDSRGRYRLTMVALVVLLVLVNTALAWRWRHFAAETGTLQAGMSQAARERSQIRVATDGNRQRVAAELLRRRARTDGQLHLSIVADSGRADLERDGVVLRSMLVRVGAARLSGRETDTLSVQAPRGLQVVQRLVSATDTWEVPRWIFADRGIAIPSDRRVKGALGRTGVLLEGGWLLYALPTQGPLADSGYVLPGGILFTADDMRALAPNVSIGMSVYFLE